VTTATITKKAMTERKTMRVEDELEILEDDDEMMIVDDVDGWSFQNDQMKSQSRRRTFGRMARRPMTCTIWCLSTTTSLSEMGNSKTRFLN
jgi:hypothetical protein